MATSDQVLQPVRWFRLFYRLAFCLVPSMNKHLLSHVHFHSQQHWDKTMLTYFMFFNIRNTNIFRHYSLN
jgi:hypothetical protein